MKSSELLAVRVWPHVSLSKEHPVGECDIIGFLGLEIVKWLVQQIEEETPAGRWFKCSNVVAKSCYYCTVILHFSCKNKLTLQIRPFGGSGYDISPLLCIIAVLLSLSSRNDGRTAQPGPAPAGAAGGPLHRGRGREGEWAPPLPAPRRVRPALRRPCRSCLRRNVRYPYLCFDRSFA